MSKINGGNIRLIRNVVRNIKTKYPKTEITGYWDKTTGWFHVVNGDWFKYNSEAYRSLVKSYRKVFKAKKMVVIFSHLPEQTVRSIVKTSTFRGTRVMRIL